jgi:formylglycine-generating enzyme required for sulfatase activity
MTRESFRKRVSLYATGRHCAGGLCRKPLGLWLLFVAVTVWTGRCCGGSPHPEGDPHPTLEEPYENSLGMRFVPVPGTQVLFSIWDTRQRDYAAYARTNAGVDDSWRFPKYEGVDVTPSDDCPVVNVSWNDAVAFCQWLTQKERAEGKIGREASYRLPTDVEWSWAVGIGGRESAGTPKEKDRKLEGEYPWGTQWPPPARAGNFADDKAKEAFPSLDAIDSFRDGFATTSPVGTFASNRFGLYDMGGNVWQWCQDTNASSGQETRLLRGSSWFTYARANLLSSRRRINNAGTRSRKFGFRCVLEPGPAPEKSSAR